MFFPKGDLILLLYRQTLWPVKIKVSIIRKLTVDFKRKFPRILPENPTCEAKIYIPELGMVVVGRDSFEWK